MTSIDVPKVVRGTKNASDTPCILALGKFDGLHRGHQTLIEVMQCTKPDLPVALLSFYPHPAKVLSKSTYIEPLYTRRLNLKWMHRYGVSRVHFARFSKYFLQLEYQDFLKLYVIQWCNACHLVIGEDAAVGYRRAGTAKKIKAFMNLSGLGCSIVPPIRSNGQSKIGSRAIRMAVKNGDLRGAACMLGRPVSYLGKVIYGNQKGRTIGVPTANLGIPSQTQPPFGVYVGWTHLKGTLYESVINVGARPTIDTNSELIESHLLDYQEEAFYGEEVEVFLGMRLRAQKAFSSFQLLTAQINTDISMARRWFDDESFQTWFPSPGKLT